MVIAPAFYASCALVVTAPRDARGQESRVLNPRRLTRTVPLIDGHDLQFRRVSAEGLSQTRVAQIAQDDQGFLWFGTQRGLYRYDGHALQVFRHVASREHTMSGVYVYSLAKGRRNTLWVGSDGFLDRLDPRREQFTQQAIHAEGTQARPIVNISCVIEDPSGTLWLCTRGGLYRIDPGTPQAMVLRHRAGDPRSLSSDAIQFVGDDGRGSLWVGTSAGLDLLDRSSNEVVSHLPLSASTRMVVHEDRHGVVWIVHGDDGELSAFDRSANTLTAWHPANLVAGTAPVRFSAVLEDRDGTMWFGTLNHGVLKFDRAQNLLVRYTTDPSNQYSLSDRRVNALYQDREGLIWTGLHQSAPNYFVPRAPSFQGIQFAGRQSTLVSTILEDRAGLLWLGLDLGMKTLDAKRREYRDVPGLERIETTSIVEGAPGVYWIGTAGQGLRQFDQRSGRMKTFRHAPRRASSLPSDFVERVTLDTKGAVWAVTWRGLAKWEPESDRFETLRPEGAPEELTMHTAMFARNGTVWMGSNLGVHRFDPATRTFRWFRHARGDETSLSNDRVNSILESSDGSVWIGTQIGLDHWDASGKPISRYGPQSGIPGTAVSCILEDDARQLWMSTDLGIARLNVTTGVFTPYGTADGLPGVNMTGWNSCTRAKSGEMLFAGFAGAVGFFPQRVVERDYAIPVVITRFRLLDATFDEGGRRVSSLTVGGTEEIRLQPSQGKFSVEFAAPSFLSPETNRVRYRLDGLQEEWTEVYGGQREATYMALPPGTYTFEVQGASGHGPWSASAAPLRLVMLPPWWKRAWFFVLASLGVAGALFLAYRMRVRQLAHAYNVRHEERWAERTRIARELHDTLLQGFQGVMFHLQAVRDMLPDQPAKAIPVLDSALVRGEAAIDDARSAVGDLRSPERVHRDLRSGVAALAAAAAQLPNAGTNPSWDVQVKGRAREIPGTILYELYQVTQEAIGNAFRHARADHINVEILYDTNRLWIVVADDGVGCDEHILSPGQRPGHFGVQGMRERVERLGGEVTLRSRPREGTRVEVSVPATVAYRKASGGIGRLMWATYRRRKAEHD